MQSLMTSFGGKRITIFPLKKKNKENTIDFMSSH